MKITVNLEQALVIKCYEPLALRIERWNKRLHCYALSNICTWLLVFLSAAAYLWHLADSHKDKHMAMGLKSIYFFIMATICLTHEYNAEHVARERKRDVALTPSKMNRELKNAFFRMLILAWFVGSPIMSMIIFMEDPEMFRTDTLITLALGFVFYSGLAFRACDPAYLTKDPEEE